MAGVPKRPVGRPSRTYSFNLKESKRHKRSDERFQMYFAELELALRDYAASGQQANIGAKSRTVVYEELGKFGKDVLEPVFKARAPVREWGGNPEAPRRKLLRDTIKAVRSRKGQATPEVRIDMGGWGIRTIEGRPALSGKKVFKLILPGGQVIFRREVGPATTRAFSTGEVANWDGSLPHRHYDLGKARGRNPGRVSRETGGPKGRGFGGFPPKSAGQARQRMKWAEYAWDDIKRSGKLWALELAVINRMLDSSLLARLAFVRGADSSEDRSYAQSALDTAQNADEADVRASARRNLQAEQERRQHKRVSRTERRGLRTQKKTRADKSITRTNLERLDEDLETYHRTLQSDLAEKEEMERTPVAERDEWWHEDYNELLTSIAKTHNIIKHHSAAQATTKAMHLK